MLGESGALLLDSLLFSSDQSLATLFQTQKLYFNTLNYIYIYIYIYIYH